MAKRIKQEKSFRMRQCLPVFLDHPETMPLASSSIGLSNRTKMLTQGKTRTYAQRINHIWSERERRREVQGLYDQLRSLLPKDTSKMDRSTVVEETMELIQSLKNQVEELSSRRSTLQLLPKMSSSSKLKPGSDPAASFALHVSNSDVFVNLSCKIRPKLVSRVLWILRQHQLIVQDASISVDPSRTACFCIRSKALDIDHLAKESLELSLRSLFHG